MRWPRRATSANRFNWGGALDFDEVQTVTTLMPWLWAVQTCIFSEAGEAETPATTADAQQDCMTENFSRIRPLRGYHHAIEQKIRSTRFCSGMLHAMCDVNPSFQSMRIEKTCPESACRSARLKALCKRPQTEDLIARLTDTEFLAESLATGQP